MKTRTRDALHLAQFLKLGEITCVRVPSVDREAATDDVGGQVLAPGFVDKCEWDIGPVVVFGSGRR